MTKIQILCFALFVMCALGGIAATSAFAEPEWLVEKLAVKATLPVETEWLLDMIALEGGKRLMVIGCGGVLDGTIGPPTAAKPGIGTDEITAALSLNQELIGSTGCLVSESEGGIFDCILNALAAFSLENLPWTTELELMSAAPIWLDVFLKNGSGPAWHVECETGLGTIFTILCEVLSAAMSNDPTSTPPSVLSESETSPVCNVSSGTATIDPEGSEKIWAIGAELERLEMTIS